MRLTCPRTASLTGTRASPTSTRPMSRAQTGASTRAFRTRRALTLSADTSLVNWKPMVDSADGTVGASGGALTVSDIPNLPASKTTSGTFGTGRIPNLNANKIASGVIAIARLPVSSFSIAASQITGVLSSARIPNLAASIISSGTFSVSRIPNLAASIITSGTFGAEPHPELARVADNVRRVQR